MFGCESLGDSGDTRIDLAAERAAVCERRNSWFARKCPSSVGLEVRGIDPARLQCGRPLPVGNSDWVGGFKSCSASLNLARHRAGLMQRLADDPFAGFAQHRHQRIGGSSVIGEPANAQSN